jgi:ABC-type phosphate transport system substrate-binding protein
VRFLKTLVAAGGAAAVATAMVAAPALADPINSHKARTTPAPYDIVSVGSESIAFVSDQLSWNYNKTVKHHSPSHPYYYSWDGVPAGNPNNTTQKIQVKAGAACRNARPDGSTAGIKALTTYGSETYKGKSYPCVNFARSSRPFSAADDDPPFAPGGVAFDTLWQDAVTYSSAAKTNVPNDLTLTDLSEIFGCTIPAKTWSTPTGPVTYPAGTWGALLGPSAKDPMGSPDPILPQKGSGTLAFFTGVLGIGTSEPTCGTAKSLTVDQQPEENEGISVYFRNGNKASGKPNPNVIFPFSVGVWLAQEYHSAKCGKKPSKSQNMFGCDVNGVFSLDGIHSGGKNVKPFTGSGKKAVTNSAWKKTPFERFLYAVVPYSSTTSDHIPSNLEGLLGKKGFFCSKKEASTIAHYGFESTKLCGFTS